MDVKYQIFISSTYEDLKQERDVVMKAIMELNHIPAGMEQFPAMDKEQLEYIKRIIDISDYYVLIIAGRYGSTDSTGISYTEMEYDYAIKQGIPTLVFIHQEIDKIEFGKSERDQEKRLKLENFKQMVSKNRIVKFWTEASDLALKVSSSISQAINLYPRTGWARANKFANEELMADYIVANKQVNELKEKLSSYEIKPLYEDLAKMSESFSFAILGTFNHRLNISYSWDRLFSIFAHNIISYEIDTKINHNVTQDIIEHEAAPTAYFSESSIGLIAFYDIINQFVCNGLIDASSNKIKLTQTGLEYYRRARAIKSTDIKN